MELDHVIVGVRPGALEARELLEWGLVEGPSNTHPGQGTANRRFYFDNAYIELLYMTSYEEISSPRILPTRLRERLTLGACDISPLGVCFRPSIPGEVCPFPHWAYQAPYLPPEIALGFAQAQDLREPLRVFVPMGHSPGPSPQPRHRRITQVILTHESPQPLAPEDCVVYTKGEDPLMEIVLDHGAQGQAHDIRPRLPLIFRW